MEESILNGILPKISYIEEHTDTKHSSEPEKNENGKLPKSLKRCSNVSEDNAGHERKRPKIRIDIKEPKEKQIYRYGNYSKYYGYRNNKDSHDVRIDLFKNNKELFLGKDILDIGCNSGFVTTAMAKDFNIKHITGIDIDKSLINRALKYVRKKRKYFIGNNKDGYPFNITFVHGNYILRDEVLLEIEEMQFDVILCLSITKWLHLNFGDAGLKLAFKRIFLQLRSGGRLILEPQPFQSYKRRKKLTPDIFENYKAMQFFPKDFTSYLLGPEVGFSEVYDLGIPKNTSQGFSRPIQVFVKK